MSWSREQVSLLLEEYQKWPNLFRIKSPNYKNRNLRRTALEAIQMPLKSLKPNVTIAEIQSKFQALRQNATKEYKKVLNAKKSGAGEDEMYSPSLWYFEEISFIFHDGPIMRQASDSLSQNEVMHSEDQTPEPPMQDSDCETDGNDEVYEAEVDTDGSLFLPNEPLPLTLASINRGNNQTPGAQVKRQRDNESSLITPGPRGKKKQTDADFLESMSGSLSSLTEKLIEQQINTVEPHPVKSISQNFSEYICGKLERISDEDIRNEVEVEIVTIINKAITESKKKNQSVKKD